MKFSFNFSKKELKLFLMFFVIYSLFIHWMVWNEDSRFDLVKAVVDEGRFEIDNYFNNTGDRSFYSGHYYSSQNPGMSFLSISTYTTWKFIYNNFFSENFRETHSGSSLYVAVNSTQIHEITWFFYPDLGFFFYISMILITVFTSSLFGALTVLLIYKISLYVSKNNKNRIILSIIAGFGTIIFPMSLIFIENSCSAFFAFASFYFLFKARVEKRKDNKLFLFGGLLSGFGVMISFFVTIVAITNLIYVFLTRKKGLVYYLIGGFLGILPLLLYYFVIFHSPFVGPEMYLDQSIWGDMGSKAWIYNPYMTLRLLFYSEIGLFFYFPVLLFSFFGLYYFYKKFKFESILFLIIFLLNLIVASSMPYNWLGGFAIGPRYLTMSIPFLVLLLIGLFDDFNGKKIFKTILFILVLFSISINFFLLQDYTELVSNKENVPPNLEQLVSFKIIRNNINEYYLPQFLKNGPRSKIMEGLLTNPTKIDIRIFQLQPTSGIKFFTTSFGFLTFRLKTLPITLIILVVFLIWRKEITKLISKKYILFGGGLIIFLALDLQTITYGDNWYPIWKNETYTYPYMWMRDNGTIYLFSQKDDCLFFNSTIISFNKTRKLNLYLNGDFVNNYSIYYETLGLKLNVNKGKNVLKLHSVDGCDNYLNISCLSFAIGNFAIFTFEELTKKSSIIYGDNWYPPYKNETYSDSYRWMNQDSQIYLFSPKKGNAIISFSFVSYTNQTFDLIFNNKTINSYSSRFTNTTYPEIIQLELGENVLSIHSYEGCRIHYMPLEKTDVCLSIGIHNLQILTKDNFNASQIMWGRNWFDEEKIVNATYRWMSNNATIYLISSDKESKQINLTFSVRSYHKPRTLQLLFGNYSKEMIISTSRQEISTDLVINPGINALEIISKEGCESPSTIENSTDERCLSFAMSI